MSLVSPHSTTPSVAVLAELVAAAAEHVALDNKLLPAEEYTIV